jgi:hypothetical protein
MVRIARIDGKRGGGGGEKQRQSDQSRIAHVAPSVVTVGGRQRAMEVPVLPVP